MFSSWSHGLPGEVAVHGVQLPGRQKRIAEEPCRRTEQVVAPLVEAVASMAPSPVVLFGDCTGAFIAFELGRQLQARGQGRRVHLVVSCCRAPQLPYRQSPIHGLPADELRKKLVALDVVPSWLLQSERAFGDYLPLLRADFELAESYTYEPSGPLSYPITAFAGSEDAYTTIDEVHAWSSQTTTSFQARVFEAGHNLSKTHRAMLLLEIARVVDLAMGEPS
jgi:medium-chain acyl-[acyl-carrier-protein] hydrolase